MTQYAVLRIDKIKNMSGVHNYAHHNNRTSKTEDFSNIDKSKTHQNILSGFAGQSNDDIRAIYKTRIENLKKKPRPDAVHGIDLVMSASAEFFETATKEKQQEFFKKCREWVEDNFGGATNILASWEHHDEQTPHIHFVVFPECPAGKMNAKHYLGGHKNKLAEFQTTFAQKVEHLGLSRGERKSEALHTSVRQYHKDTTYALKLENEKQQGLSSALVLELDTVQQARRNAIRSRDEAHALEQRLSVLYEEALRAKEDAEKKLLQAQDWEQQSKTSYYEYQTLIAELLPLKSTLEMMGYTFPTIESTPDNEFKGTDYSAGIFNDDEPKPNSTELTFGY